MKSFIAFITIALIAVFIVPTESKTCTVTCNTSSTTNICAKYGSTCRRYTNGCAFKLYNCVNSASYAKVALSRCSSISVGYSGTCGSATYSTGTSVSSILNSLGLYGYYGSSSVTPIVIRV